MRSQAVAHVYAAVVYSCVIRLGLLRAQVPGVFMYMCSGGWVYVCMRRVDL